MNKNKVDFSTWYESRYGVNPEYEHTDVLIHVYGYYEKYLKE